MIILYILQALIPLVLIAWILVAPQRSVIGFWTQAVATGLGLIAMSLAGVLLFPPWWTPGALGLLLIAIVLTVQRRRPLATFKPRGISAWIVTVGFAAFALFSASQTRLAYAASQIPSGSFINLASPLGPGHYLIINGGTTMVLNAHADALDQSIPAHKAFYGTAYGVDLVAIDRWGLRATGVMPTDPQRYRIFRTAVVAPCSGTAMAAVDGLPDKRVPDQDERHLAGNHVILRCDGVDILLAHFSRGSVRVRPGQEVAVGIVLALVGNSGATGEPHLHIHAQKPGTQEAPFSGNPIPIKIAGRFLVRNTRLEVRGGPPAAAQRVAADR